MLAAHGFGVVRASYWNTLLLPLMLLHRLIKRDEAESDVRDYPRLLDTLFSAALAIERAVHRSRASVCRLADHCWSSRSAGIERLDRVFVAEAEDLAAHRRIDPGAHPTESARRTD